jgi:hypothetical protein
MTREENEARIKALCRHDLEVEAMEAFDLLNNPIILEFLDGTRAEVAHQIQRWGTVGDRAKAPADWFWLVGYLAGKALAAHVKGDLNNFAEFKAKAEATDTISIGFNNRRFDDQLVKHLGIDIPPWQSWDLLREIWISKGLNPDSFNPRTHGGFGLDAVAMANGLGGKSGNGALAPVLWQQGKKGAVIDYCLRDVMLTKKCVERAIANQLICPVTGETMRLDLGRLSPLPTP